MACGWSKSSSSPCPGRLSHATAAGARGLEEVLEDEERAIERHRRSSRSGGGARERGAGHRAPPTQPARHELYRKGDPFPLDLLVRTQRSGETRGRRRPTCGEATEQAAGAWRGDGAEKQTEGGLHSFSGERGGDFRKMSSGTTFHGRREYT